MYKHFIRYQLARYLPENKKKKTLNRNLNFLIMRRKITAQNKYYKTM